VIVVLGLVLGAIVGAWRAHRRRGTGLDMAQWAAVHAILFGLVGLVATIVVGRVA
jgi:hypothetical protein